MAILVPHLFLLSEVLGELSCNVISLEDTGKVVQIFYPKTFGVIYEKRNFDFVVTTLLGDQCVSMSNLNIMLYLLLLWGRTIGVESLYKYLKNVRT